MEIRWTIGEYIDLEAVTGISVSKLQHYQKSEEDIPLVVVAGFVWLYERRSNPKVTFQQIRDLDADEFEARTSAMGEVEEPNPTEGGSSESSPASVISGVSHLQSSAASQ